MATTTALARVNWLVKTWAPARLTTIGRTDLVTTINAMATINTAARMTTARTWILERETELWAAYTPAWDQHWEATSNEIFDNFLAQMPSDTLAAIFADTDVNSKATLKAVLRTIELFRCRQAAG